MLATKSSISSQVQLNYYDLDLQVFQTEKGLHLSRDTLTDSPFSKWEPADYPMRDWPFSNVRGTKQRHTRTTLNEDKEGLPVPAQMHN